MTIDTKWFQTQIQNRGLSQRKLSKVLKLDPSALSRSIKGLRKLTIEEATSLSTVLEIPLEEVLGRLGIDLDQDSPTKGAKTSVSGYFDHTLTLRTDKAGLRGSKSVPLPFSDKDISVGRIQNSESPIDGALIYFRKCKSFDSENLGKLCLVKVGGEKDLKLRVLKRGYTPGKFILTNMGGTILEEDVRVEVTCPVVWMKI